MDLKGRVAIVTGAGRGLGLAYASALAAAGAAVAVNDADADQAAAAVESIGEAGGVAVGSPAGQRGNVGQTNYSAAKAAIVGMVRTWAMECERAGITVNAVIPVAATAMTATIPAFAPHVQALLDEGTPLPSCLRAAEGFGVPEDAAGLVVFLASAASSGITGQAIGIGGDKLSLWSHPDEIATAYRSGGWSAEDIAEIWPVSVGRVAQSVGITPPAPRG